ncbi:hypothetical protein F53441_12522 [Fusarium austroafricanum]|uniref:Rab-GAP TBC domain-containing protein n=1 Tax=Fusarium austroafricanum TaxID=2364996 RepID=A0A8H4NPQ7_9HYPO|nr:hypothetical protein F53441_12522 [Fusarium austroafricanum]
MRPLEESLHLYTARDGVRHNPMGRISAIYDVLFDAMARQVHTFLLSTAAEGLSWSQVLDEGRKFYKEQRDHFLKYIKHPEALAELNIDPLTEDPSSPWNTIRQDEIVRAEIQQDVQRLPDEASYHENQTQAIILDILFMYCKLNPERGGYRQGMHELLAPILYVIEQDAVDPTTLPAGTPLDDALVKTLDHSYIEHDAFTLFSKLMEQAQSFYEVKDAVTTPGSSLRHSKFAEQSSAIVERSKFIHEICLQKVDPELATHLTNIEILPQIFLIRWIRLLFSREFPFEQFLVLWDTIFAVDPTLELIDLICVAMLIRIRWDLLEADYSVCLQLLLKYPPPSGAHGPHTFVDDALYLKDHLSPSGGSSLIMKYTGRMPTISSPPQTSRAGTPNFRGFNSFRHRAPGSRTPISSPSRFLQQQGGMEALFQGAAKGAKGVFEKGEKLGINQAVRDAMGEIKRNINEARSAPRSPQPLANEDEATRSLAALERRNQHLAAMLDETVNNLKALSASNLDDKAKSLELIEIAAAKVQFVKIYLDDSSIEVPILQSPPPEESLREVTVAETTIVHPEPVSAAPAGVDISGLQISESKSTAESEVARPSSPDRMDIVSPDDNNPPNSLAPTRPAPVPTRSTLAQSSFSWMLEPDESGPSKASLTSNKSPPPQHKKKLSNSASREKNAFLFGEVAESRIPLNSHEIFGLEPLKKLKNAKDEKKTDEDQFCVLPEDYLVQAQWAVDQFETALYNHDLTTADFRRKLEVENEVESWAVEFDGNIQEDQFNQYDWIGLKLTDIFRFLPPESPFPEADCKTVMNILHKMFLTVANSDTRLGIKVAIPKRNACLDQLKAIASMIWLLDPLLGDIRPPHCGPGSIHSLGLQYTNLIRDRPINLQTELASTIQVEDPWNNRLSPNRRPLELLSDPGELRRPKYNHEADRILSAGSIEELIRLLGIKIQDARNFPHARPAYRFFIDRESETIDIKFNQHCGTLNIIEILRWTTLCVELIQHCLDKSGIFLYESYPGLNYHSTILIFSKSRIWKRCPDISNLKQKP